MLKIIPSLVLIACQSRHASEPGHTARDIEGWTVQVDQRLFQDPNRALGQNAIRLLSDQLFLIKMRVPADKVAWMQTNVPIWLDLDQGDLRQPQYHPSADWLRENHHPVGLAKCVHIPTASYFVDKKFQLVQPLAILHELAHAYHDQVLGFENPEIKAAWQQAVDSHKFDSVLHVNGKKQKHYALTNQMEFFAEMTESYFGANDFYPFNQGELRDFAPEIFDLMQKTWGKTP
jgi:hypothetical protein